MMRVSPSGEKIAYRLTGDKRDYMVVLDLISGKVLASLDISEIRPENTYFIDESRLIFVSTSNNRLRGFWGRHEISRAFSFNIETKKIHSLLDPGYGIYRGQTNLGSIVSISSDGKYTYMPTWVNQSSYSLVKSNLDIQRKPRVFKKGTSNTIDFFVDNKDTIIARETYDNSTDIHKLQAIKDGKWVDIFEETTKYRTKSFVGMTPDYQSIVMLKQDKEHGRFAYYTISIKDGSISAPLFSHKNKDVEHVLTNINRVVYGVMYSGFKPTYEFFDQKLNKLFVEISQSLPDNTFLLSDHTPDWSKIVFYVEGSGSSGEYFIYEKGEFFALASARPQIEPEQVNQVSEFHYSARDGLKIPALVTLPNVEKVKKLPAILLPHGGPESYDKYGFDWLAQYFSSQGYLVIQPQFRGSSGFGAAHLLAGRGEWGRKMQDDLTDAIKALADKGYIDPNRVCIVGASYGGYAALAGATFNPEKYKCAISINGVSDVHLLIKESKKKYGRDHWVLSYWSDVISKGEVKEEHLDNISPINYVEQASIPVLLIHGERDEVVSIKQSEEMFEKLEDKGKDVKFIELEKGDHYLSNSENRMRTLKVIHDFVHKHLSTI